MSKERRDKHFIKQPVYPGGGKALTEFIYQHLQYPATAVEAGVEGVVLVEFDIDYKGRVVATRVVQGIGHGCDEEACRVVKLLQYEVGKNRGMNVVFHQKAKIQFKKPVPVPIAVLPDAPITIQLPVAEGQQIQYQYSVAVQPDQNQGETAAAQPQVFTYTITIQ